MLGLEALRMSLASLWSHKMRSTLTILGVVIGVASVLAVTSLGAAFEESITSQFDSVDDRSIFVQIGATGPQNGPPEGGQTTFVFTDVDRGHLEDLPGVERVIASGEVSISSITFNGAQRAFESIQATSANADEIRNGDDYLVGGPFEDGDSKVVLGYSIAKYLSGAKAGEEPTVAVGDSLSIRYPDGTAKTATVAGVLAEQESLFGTNNGLLFVPLDPFYQRLIESPSTGQDTQVFAGFTVVSDEGTDIDTVRDAVRDYLNSNSDAIRFLADTEGVEILVATASDIQGQISTAFDQITIFIAGIAGVSLLVGGIMIGTIMLISVTERTKEIGMMKAIGALNREVLVMFLLEAAIIGLLGSLIGILLGVAAGAALIAGLFGGEDVSFVMPWNWVGIAVLVGVGTGVIAGLLPARRAVGIQPVEALNYE